MLTFFPPCVNMGFKCVRSKLKKNEYMLLQAALGKCCIAAPPVAVFLNFDPRPGVIMKCERTKKNVI